MHNGPGPAYVHGTIKPYENIYPEPHNIFTMGCLRNTSDVLLTGIHWDSAQIICRECIHSNEIGSK